MKALVIYDATGRIWGIYYGESEIPQGMTYMYVDIPEGASLEKIDVTDPKNPKPVFLDAGGTDIDDLKGRAAQLEEELSAVQLALAEQYEENLQLKEEVTNLQLALTEIYEKEI